MKKKQPKGHAWNSTLRSKSDKQKQKDIEWTKNKQRAITEQLDIWGYTHCELCGKPVFYTGLEAHHMKRRSRGGEYTWDNLRLVGIWCDNKGGCHGKFTRNEV